jgi:hypothetical protein
VATELATELATESGSFWIETVFDTLSDISDGMFGVGCVHTNYEIHTYKVTTANKTPPPLRIFFSWKY